MSCTTRLIFHDSSRVVHLVRDTCVSTVGKRISGVVFELSLILIPHFTLLFSAWGFGFVAVTSISLCSLLGAFVVPFMKRSYYKILLMFMVSLAVGVLCGSGLFHLLPHVRAFSPPCSPGFPREGVGGGDGHGDGHDDDGVSVVGGGGGDKDNDDDDDDDDDDGGGGGDSDGGSGGGDDDDDHGGGGAGGCDSDNGGNQMLMVVMMMMTMMMMMMMMR